MSITIWGRSNSLNVHKVLWLAAELGLQFEHIPAGQQYGLIDTSEFLTRNPNGLIPVVQDDDTVLWESNTILRYLTEVYGKNLLWIEDPKLRYSAEKWIDWYTTTVLPVFGIVFFNLVRQPKDKRDIAATEAAAEKLEKILDVANSELAKQPYLLGSNFGVADIPLALAINHWFNLDIKRHHDHTDLEAWIKRIRLREHFLKVADVL